MRSYSLRKIENSMYSISITIYNDSIIDHQKPNSSVESIPYRQRFRLSSASLRVKYIHSSTMLMTICQKTATTLKTKSQILPVKKIPTKWMTLKKGLTRVDIGKSHSCPEQIGNRRDIPPPFNIYLFLIPIFFCMFLFFCFNAKLKQSATVVGARLLADDSFGGGIFGWPLFFVAFLGPVSFQRFQAATRQDTRRRKEDGRDGVGVKKKEKKGDDLRRRQYLQYPNIGTANVLEKSVALFRFSRVLFLSRPRQKRTRSIYHSFLINFNFIQ